MGHYSQVGSCCCKDCEYTGGCSCIGQDPETDHPNQFYNGIDCDPGLHQICDPDNPGNVIGVPCVDHIYRAVSVIVPNMTLGSTACPIIGATYVLQNYSAYNPDYINGTVVPCGQRLASIVTDCIWRYGGSDYQIGVNPANRCTQNNNPCTECQIGPTPGGSPTRFYSGFSITLDIRNGPTTPTISIAIGNYIFPNGQCLNCTGSYRPAAGVGVPINCTGQTAFILASTNNALTCPFPLNITLEV